MIALSLAKNPVYPIHRMIAFAFPKRKKSLNCYFVPSTKKCLCCLTPKAEFNENVSKISLCQRY
jgi:hypothetical protein